MAIMSSASAPATSRNGRRAAGRTRRRSGPKRPRSHELARSAARVSGAWIDEVRGRLIPNQLLGRKVTWFRVGGPAQLFFQPADEDDLAFFLKNLPQDIKVTLIGLGSNLLDPRRRARRRRHPPVGQGVRRHRGARRSPIARRHGAAGRQGRRPPRPMPGSTG